MQLILASDAVRNTIFTNETGQVLYKTSHPRFEVGGTTTIYKTVPNEDPMDMHDQFDVMGEIGWRVFASSTFRIHGKEMQSKEFLHRHGILGRKRTFTGPDGLPYKWDMLLLTVVVHAGRVRLIYMFRPSFFQLSRDDESQTEVARYHRGSLGITGAKRKPRLEINPEVTHMMDLIVLTFVYVETLRMDKEKSKRGGPRCEPSADLSEQFH